MKKVVRLTESDLTRLVKRVITESTNDSLLQDIYYKLSKCPSGSKASSAIDAIDIAQRMFDALDDNAAIPIFGATNERAMREQLKKIKTYKDMCAVSQMYRKLNNSSLIADIDGDYDLGSLTEILTDIQEKINNGWSDNQGNSDVDKPEPEPYIPPKRRR